MAAKKVQPFKHHVQELRQRIIVVVVVAFCGAVAGYAFHRQLIEWFSAPLHQNLYYTSPAGAFQFTLQICMLVGCLLALPVAVYQLMRFVHPAIEHLTGKGDIGRLSTLRFILSSYILALTGAAFAYFVALPLAFHFFAGFSSSQVQSFITADKYFSFVLNCIGVFAAIFQLPIIMLFINRIRPLSPRKLRQYRKWVIVGSFGAALFLPFAYDPVSQLMLALPLIILYEVSIILVAIANAERRYQQAVAKAQRIGAQPVIQQSKPASTQSRTSHGSQPISKVAKTAAQPIAIQKTPPRRYHRDWQFVYNPRPTVRSAPRTARIANHKPNPALQSMDILTIRPLDYGQAQQ